MSIVSSPVHWLSVAPHAPEVQLLVEAHARVLRVTRDVMATSDVDGVGVRHEVASTATGEDGQECESQNGAST